MAKLVSKTYGDALFEVAKEEDKVDAFFVESKEVLNILNTNQDFAKLMNHPKIVSEEKVQIMESIFKGRISDEIVGLMRVLILKSRFKQMPSVFEYFIQIVKEYKSIGIAHIYSARELSDDQKTEIVNKLIHTTGYAEVEMNYIVDPSLLGGIKIQVGDRVIDGTIKTRINDLKRELLKIQLKVGECTP
ncbi:MAG: F0F1 ATP synthase subunit delta [Lachnospiraceae bacterium]